MTEIQNTLAGYQQEVERIDAEISRLKSIRADKVDAIKHLEKSGVKLPDQPKPAVEVPAAS